MDNEAKYIELALRLLLLTMEDSLDIVLEVLEDAEEITDEIQSF